MAAKLAQDGMDTRSRKPIWCCPSQATIRRHSTESASLSAQHTCTKSPLHSTSDRAFTPCIKTTQLMKVNLLSGRSSLPLCKARCFDVSIECDDWLDFRREERSGHSMSATSPSPQCTRAPYKLSKAFLPRFGIISSRDRSLSLPSCLVCNRKDIAHNLYRINHMLKGG